MQVEREWLRWVVFGRQSSRRFTQESPILPDVWMVGGVQYCRNPKRRIDFLLTPHRDHSAGALGTALQRRLTATTDEPRPVQDEGGNDLLITRAVWTLAVSQVSVAVSLTLEELITTALPLAPWWKRNLKSIRELLEGKSEGNDEVRWMYQIVGTLVLCGRAPADERERLPHNLWFGDDRSDASRDDEDPLLSDPGEAVPRATNADYDRFRAIVTDHEGQREEFKRLARRALQLASDGAAPMTSDTIQGVEPARPLDAAAPAMLWNVGLNRRARSAIHRSIPATKADAARRLFNVRCQDLTWAVVDTGIDARHPGFFDLSRPHSNWPLQEIVPADSRVKASYDFTRLRKLITLDSHPSTGPSRLDQERGSGGGGPPFQGDAAAPAVGTRARLDTDRAAARAIRHEPDLLPAARSRPRHPRRRHPRRVRGRPEGRAKACAPTSALYDLRVLDGRRPGRRVLDHRGAAVHPPPQRRRRSSR